MLKKHTIKNRRRKKHYTQPKYRVDVHVSANSQTGNSYPYSRYHKKKR